MRFIRAVEITGFRSIGHLTISDLEDAIPIVGPNGSGKSNILRALNLFFNGEVESGYPLDLRRDFFDPHHRSKSKKQISIAVTMRLENPLRKALQEALNQHAEGSSDFTIQKQYALDSATHDSIVSIWIGPAGGSLKKVPINEHSLVERLLRAVRFRYISNHVHPTELLQNEGENIRRVLFDRLGKSPHFGGEQLALMGDAARSLLEPASAKMRMAVGAGFHVELDTPDDWRELIWTFGLRIGSSVDERREVRLHGSGIQSALAYAIMYLIDSSLGNEFGWRKGAIWAIEEPESFLHADLQAKLAAAFNDYTATDRIQIAYSTHSTAFLGLADSGVLVTAGDGASLVEMRDRNSLVRYATSSGLSPYSHPLHLGALKPMLLVEGKDDRLLIQRAYKAAEQLCPYDIVALNDLEPGMSGGVDQISTYLKNNKAAIRARPAGSPIICLVDWEVSPGKVGSISKLLEPHSGSRCVAFPRELRPSIYHKGIVGLESFLATSFFDHASEAIGLDVVRRNNPPAGEWELMIEKDELGSKKVELHRLLHQRDNPDDIAPLVAAVPWISSLLSSETLPI